MTTTDQFTVSFRLCDDFGLISDELTLGGMGLTYRQLMNNLRATTGLAPYTGLAIRCTGSAHLAGQHIRCTSPKHITTSSPPPLVMTSHCAGCRCSTTTTIF